MRAKRIWEGQGYVMQEDKGILAPLLISSLPFGLYDEGGNIESLERDFIAPVDAVTHVLPVQADFSGGRQAGDFLHRQKGPGMRAGYL